MFNFKEVLVLLGDECFEYFGELIFINGVEVRVIFDDEIFEEEVGFFRKIMFFVKKEDMVCFKKGDFIVVCNCSYVVIYILDID